MNSQIQVHRLRQMRSRTQFRDFISKFHIDVLRILQQFFHSAFFNGRHGHHLSVRSLRVFACYSNAGTDGCRINGVAEASYDRAQSLAL